MKPRFSNQRNHALTLVEVLVVIVVVGVLATGLLLGISEMKRETSHINCFETLKCIGLAYKFWAGDHDDKYPMFVSVTNGGAMEAIAAGNVAACFQVMSNELNTPKLLICPKDADRIAATNFTSDFNNSKISYFVGLNTNTNSPQVFLSGDDNFAIGGVPVKSGLLEFSTNASVTWTTTRHKFGGNIGFVDGNVQGMSSETLQEALQKNGGFTNRLAIP
ncbi:MAG TPA: prepilin-type N-terminal cleavage/methylation domain-containing protein [Verrucomicrobiae bacterium]